MKASPYPCPCFLCGELILLSEKAYEIRTKKAGRFIGRRSYIHRACWEKLPKRGDREGSK